MKKKITLDKLNNIKLSIGCGLKDEELDYAPVPKLEEFIGIDLIDFGQEIVWDIRDGIPLPDNSCSYIWASHIFEHFDTDEIIKIMNECWRVLNTEGVLEIRSPDISSSSAYFPQHKSQLHKDYFTFFTSAFVKVYSIKIWRLTESKVYHRKGKKYDLRVIMNPLK